MHMGAACPSNLRFCPFNFRASATCNLPGQMYLRDLLAAVSLFDCTGQLGIWSMQ